MVITVLLLLFALFAPASTSCDASLWRQHVYKPSRLAVLAPCVTITGTIADATVARKKHDPDGVRHEADGDTHGWLTVDPPFRHLLNAGNDSDEGGNLVYEAVCTYRVTQADAKPPAAAIARACSCSPLGREWRSRVCWCVTGTTPTG